MELKLIDHIVIIVKYIGETEKFYTSFLGNPVHHDDQKVVYQVGYTKLFLKSPQGEFEERDKDKGGLNHIAFGVNSVEQLREFEEVLNKASIKNSGVKIDTSGGKDYIWFDDPSGFRVEIYCRPL
jgi:catechol-2,3-dioxygenase